MDVDLTPDLDRLEWDKVVHLFQRVGWGDRDPGDVERSFRRSSHVCVVRENGRLVAFGRTVDDGIYYALIVDVVVHPEHQGKGIGRTIVTTLKDRLVGYNFVTLTAAPNKEGFYEKLGWTRQRSAFLFPKDEEQRRQHGVVDADPGNTGT